MMDDILQAAVNHQDGLPRFTCHILHWYNYLQNDSVYPFLPSYLRSFPFHLTSNLPIFKWQAPRVHPTVLTEIAIMTSSFITHNASRQ